MSTGNSYLFNSHLSPRSRCAVLTWLYLWAYANPSEVTPAGRRQLSQLMIKAKGHRDT